jgi:tetraacyldisaccharide 4'-kinase
MEKRREAYRRGIFKSLSVEVPVVSVGNLTLGGNAKTPLSIFLAKAFAERGFYPAVISRGYGRVKKRELPDPVLVSAGGGPLIAPELSGDEPSQIAMETRSLVLVSDKRIKAAREAERLGADIIILDDGHQHLALNRNVNILSFAFKGGKDLLGNGLVFPAGPLREPIPAHKDADLLVFVGPKIHPTMEKLAGTRPLFQAELKPAGLRLLSSGERVPLKDIKNKRLAAFSGLAHPAGFKKTLLSLGLFPTVFKSFGDHANYGEEERDFLERFYKFSKSDYLVSSAKDAVKLKGFRKVPVLILESTLVPRDPEALIEAILSRLPQGRLPQGRLPQGPEKVPQRFLAPSERAESLPNPALFLGDKF